MSRFDPYAPSPGWTPPLDPIPVGHVDPVAPLMFVCTDDAPAWLTDTMCADGSAAHQWRTVREVSPAPVPTEAPLASTTRAGDDEFALLTTPASVPEPAVCVLLAAGAALLARRLRRASRLAILVCALVLGASTLGRAQTSATYADRAVLTTNATFLGRVQIAAVLGAVTVVMEAPETESHAARVRLAGYVLREPEFVARRLTLLLAATVTATVEDGVVSTPLTDVQISGLLAQRWTVLAEALTPAGGGQ